MRYLRMEVEMEMEMEVEVEVEVENGSKQEGNGRLIMLTSGLRSTRLVQVLCARTTVPLPLALYTKDMVEQTVQASSLERKNQQG